MDYFFPYLYFAFITSFHGGFMTQINEVLRINIENLIDELYLLGKDEEVSFIFKKYGASSIDDIGSWNLNNFFLELDAINYS